MTETNKAPKAKVELELEDAAVPAPGHVPAADVEKPALADGQAQGQGQAQAGDGPASLEAAPAGGPSASAAASAAAGAVPRVQAWVRATFPGNEHTFWGGVCGLLVALVFFAIGLWRTIVVVVLVLVGAGIGQLRDGKTGLVDAARRLFSNNR